MCGHYMKNIVALDKTFQLPPKNMIVDGTHSLVECPTKPTFNLIYKSKHGVCLTDKQGRAGAVTLAFPGRYLLAAQGRAGQGQGRHPPTGPAGYIQDPWGKPGDLHLIKQKYNFFKKLFSLYNILKKL